MEPRGMLNVSGVSCHLTSALQLLFHTVAPLRQAMLLLAQAKETCSSTSHEDEDEEDWFGEMVKLCQHYHCSVVESSSGRHDAVNPERFYKALVAATSSNGIVLKSLDPYNLGDAATALRLLLQAIRQYTETYETFHAYSQILQKLLDRALFGGCIQSQFTGTRLDGTTKAKPSKERSMTCPLVLAGATDSLQNSLRLVTLEPQLVRGYVWSSTTDNEASASSEWTTHRTSRLSHLPQHILLHLERFQHLDGRMMKRDNSFDIPMLLDMSPFCHNEGDVSECCLRYELQGAIAHASDSIQEEKDDDDEEEGDGHYVALIRTQQGAWVMLDDDRVVRCSSSDVEPLWTGTWERVLENATVSYVATVLAYVRICGCDVVPTSEMLRDLRDSLVQSPPNRKAGRSGDENCKQDGTKVWCIDWEKPCDLVGRRLRVRWTKGKFYGGRVASYNEATGKHVVHYDDGDVREYILQKKTIEWE